jgi:DNA-binding CsgD family transcriptional regulator
LVSITNYAGNTRHWDRTNAALAPVEGRLNPAILMYRTGMDDIASTGAQLREVLTDRYVDRLPRMHARQVMLLAFPAYCVDTMGPFRAPLRLAYDQLCEHGASIDAIEGGRVVTLDLMATGRWEEAERVGRHCLLMSQQTQGSQLRRHQLLADLGLLAADRGNTEIARTYAARVRAWAAPRGLQRLIDGADRIEVRVALAEGDYDEAYRTATRISPAGKTPRHNIRDVIDDWFDLVEAAVRTERNTMAHQRADTAIRLGLAGISPRVEAMTLAMSAMSAPASEAGTLYRAALAHPGLAESPFHHARITLAQGIRLRRERKHTEARAALGAAAEGFDRLGSHPWAKQARIELLAATAPNTPGGSTTPTLTIQEQRIAELATAGLPTRQIADRLCISPRTVDAHLYRVFRKLDITKRSELSAALRHHRPTLVTATDSTNESP